MQSVFFLLQYLTYMLYLKTIIGLKVITEGYYITAKEKNEIKIWKRK